jgi:hypothetical protein
MITVLVDHNIEGQAALLWRTVVAEGWLDLDVLQLVTFTDLDLPFDSTDRVIWHFAQEHTMILLTDNRNMDGNDSLEQTIREDNRSDSLPVITIGDVSRIIEKSYREACVTRLAEIILYLDTYRGTGRLYIP